jgi:hypothetical protein
VATLIIPAIVFLLLGAVLGFRFKVPVLIPATIVTLVVTCTAMISFGRGFWLTALSIVEAATALQVGYLVGATLSVCCGRMRRLRDQGRGGTTAQPGE